jgi:hypothetical protein
LALLFSLLPCLALAHTSERGFVLLLPTGYYLIGGALAVAGSFLILLAIPDARFKRWLEAQRPLRALGHGSTAISLFSLAILALFVVAGYFGSRDPLSNPLPLTVWTLWWVGLTIAQAVIGDIWRHLNPWSGLFRLLPLRANPLPYRFDYWPAIIAFAAFACFELIHPAPDDPAILADAIVVYSLVTWTGMILYGEEAWLARGEAFSAFFSLIARIAPVQRAEDGRLHLGFPGRALLDLPPLPRSGILFVLLTLATVSFDGLNKTFWWLSLADVNPLEFPGRTALMGFNTAGLLAAWVALSAVFLGSIVLGGGRNLWPRAGLLAVSMLPISIGYQFAHYLTAFLVNVQYATIALTDPFAHGWFDAEHRTHHVTTSFLSNHAGVTVIWNLQAASIIGGHVVAVLVAHFIALRQQAPVAQQIPLAVLMVAYTIFGLWLLSTPAAG